MAVIKCKMCGGDLAIEQGSTVAECEYCGSRQTVPSADNEKKLTLFARANRLRAACEFDKAAGIYESIVSEFPEEAEAYWGLVLCKYGIEYVDDPGTGKKIPTCHRSSFDSVLEDENFDQTIENADIVAQRVYREEAKEFERIRKGILEVSSTEKPYDIFICYKETDEDGGRTLDSVLAQDLYTALTDKGYRVFFSRITLQGKLGEAYEPYIFAALNSAKVMLAVGTCYEYYNAVWVKNEWSRYLKICEADKSKHLIPCYKDIDPEDMPKEFSHLQGADLGKMGAVQDILFNMEKYIPLKKQTVVQEKVVVGGAGGNNKIASLLDRGYIALEDADWAKADSFFEDVLNNDSKNAQAYLGKALAEEHCRTLDALVRKRKDSTSKTASEKLFVKAEIEHIDEAVQKYAIPGYIKQSFVRDSYEFDRYYPSEVAGRKKQFEDEVAWWTNHKWLSRAEKFATDDFAATLQNAKKQLFEELSKRIKYAEALDKTNVDSIKEKYEKHIAQTDTAIKEKYNNCIAQREADFQRLSGQVKTRTTADAFLALADALEDLRGFKDSRSLAEHCRSEAARLKKEAEDNAKALADKAAAARKRKRIAVQIAKIAAVLAIIGAIVYGIAWLAVINPTNKKRESYQNAEALLAAQDYDGAIAAFEKAENYEDAKERVKQTRYAQAEFLLENGETARAAIAFGKAGDYSDSRERSFALWNTVAVRETVSAAYYHVVGVKNDGTVVATGSNNNGECDVGEWTDIVAVSASGSSSGSFTVGLKSDGTVIATGYNVEGQCNVKGWTDIVAISTGYDYTLGLKINGTVVVVGEPPYGFSVGDWKDIVSVSAGGSHAVGLKADGAVVATGSNYGNSCNVDEWTDIVAISVGDITLGVKADGTAVAVGYNNSNQCNVDEWTDIVAVSTASNYSVGLKSDGRVVVVGNNSFNQTNASSWRNIVAVSAGIRNFVGLKSNGTVVLIREKYFNECDVSGWSDIKLPN